MANLTSLKNLKTAEQMVGNEHASKQMDVMLTRVFPAFLAHLAEGYPKQAFSYKDKDFYCCCDTVESYIDKYPDKFDPELVKAAKAERYKNLMSIGVDQSKGKIKGGNAISWSTIMRNVLRAEGWDRDDEQKDIGATKLAELTAFLQAAKALTSSVLPSAQITLSPQEDPKPS